MKYKYLLKTYTCNPNKNKKCNKKNCAYNSYVNYGCKRTTNFKYAKRTLLNYIKRFINWYLEE